jgi:hypothetical protein
MTLAATRNRPPDRHRGVPSHRRRTTRGHRLPYRVTGFLAVMAVALTPAAAAGSKNVAVRSGPVGGPAAGSPVLDAADVAQRPAPTALGKSAAAAPKATSKATGGAATAAGNRPFGPTATLFGTTVQALDSTSWTSTFATMNARYGGLEVYRSFYSGAPSPWPGTAGYGKRPVVVSFRYTPRDVLAGRYDAALAQWFRTAPKGYPIYWVYWHEPEDNVERGQITAADYRAAWRHIRAIQRSTGRMDMKATLTLMCWTIGGSGRNWRDYYAGSDVIDVMSFDCYNWAAHSSPARYATPAEIYGKAADLAASLGKPFGIAETASARLPGDPTGSGRASWLRAVGTYLNQRHAAFVCYFDVQKGNSVDYRLTDPPSRQAWARVVSG